MVRMHKGSWQRPRHKFISMMGSVCSCIEGDLEGPALWYQPGTSHSVAWCNKETGFGYRRNKSYRQIAIGNKTAMDSVNRKGNLSGELAGKIVTYEKASKNVAYSTLPECPTFNLGDREKLYAKAFFPAPLNRIPIGENNIQKNREINGRGATILAPIPQALAIFIHVDGVAQCQEHYCQDSLLGRKRELKEDENAQKKRKVTFKIPPAKPPDKNNNSSKSSINSKGKEQPRKEFLEKAVKGSFYTFVISEGQYPFCFLHLPLVGNLHDTNISTGYYGENFIRCFCDVIRSLRPGPHSIDMRICLVFDHKEYNYLVLGVGTNALGKWSKPLPNSLLKNPFEKPDMLVCSRALAKGSFVINIPTDHSIGDMLTVLDRKPPPEKYQDTDVDRIRKIARVSFLCANCGYRLMMISINLSETTQKKCTNSETKLIPRQNPIKIFSQNFFPIKIFSQQKKKKKKKLSKKKKQNNSQIWSPTEFCLGLHTAIVFRMQLFNFMLLSSHSYIDQVCF